MMTTSCQVKCVSHILGSFRIDLFKLLFFLIPHSKISLFNDDTFIYQLWFVKSAIEVFNDFGAVSGLRHPKL